MRDEPAGELGVGGAEEQYALLMECVSDYAIFLMDAGARVAAWNTGAERIFGYAEEEALGLAFARFFTPEDVEQGVPEKELRAAVEHGRATDDKWHVRKDGTRMWVSGITTALRDEEGNLRGFAKVTRDRTERREADAALRSSEELNRRILESSPDCIKVLTLDGRLLSLNEGGQRLLEIDDFQACRMADWLSFWQEADREVVQHALATARAGGRGSFQGPCPTAKGTLKWWDVVVTAILDAQGQPERLLCVSRDITGLKRTEAALKDANRRKDEFLAVLAHELRNTLAPASNSLQVMRLAGEGSGLVGQARELVERQVQQMTRLVDDLLDISRISSGKIDLRREQVELAAVIKRAVEMSRPLVDAAGHQLTVATPPERFWLEADSARLVQVLSNLLNNAAKFTERGGQIWLTAEQDGREVLLRVRDTGVGIPPEALPFLFDLFSQAERTLEQSQGGLGIGLSLVKRLVELHGGKVTGHSEGPGRGSEFVVRLPLLPEGPRETGPAEDRGGAVCTTCRVLVVDDNKDAAESMALLLRLWGHDPRTALEGGEAIKLTESFQPQVVLLDLGLPGMDGFQVARELRARNEVPRPILVALTGFGSEADQRRCLEAGFDHHLVKPVDLDALQAVLARLTGASPQQPS